MKLSAMFIEIPRELERDVLERWKIAGYPPLATYAPYAAHVVSVEVFFQFALASGLISTERPSNRVDIAYLFYLPFCSLFVSTDKLHRRCAPHFLRPDQEFVWGGDLKTGLHALNEHYSGLDQSEKEKGVMQFAATPPEDGGFLVSELWDRHLRPWRHRPDILAPGLESEIIDDLKRFIEAPTAPPEQVDFAPDDSEVVAAQRFIHKRKGSWWQSPKDLERS